LQSRDPRRRRETSWAKARVFFAAIRHDSKPRSFVYPVGGTTEQLAEKIDFRALRGEKLSAGAEARIDFANLTARVNSCPDTLLIAERTFSAGCEIVPWHFFALPDEFFRSL
jgi:hypothetical protein